MKVRLSTNYASPFRNFAAGEIVDFPQDEAAEIIAGRYGISAEDAPPIAEHEPREENASLHPAENAARRVGRSRYQSIGTAPL